MRRTKFVLLSLFATGATTVACSQDNKGIERKLDAILDKLNKMPGGAQRPQRVEPDRSKTYAVPIDGDVVEGPADAAVTLVKAYDYQCPFCEQVRDSMEELRAKYPNDLRIVYKQLVVHPNIAMAGALAFCAASKQGKHKEMDKLLWDKGFKGNPKMADASDVGAGAEKQKCWDAPDGCANAVLFAQELQLDVSQFKNDMKTSCFQLVEKDRKELQQFAVSSTPSFFINGRFLAGKMPTESFSAVIDEELKKAKASSTPAAQYYQAEVMAKGLKLVPQS